MVKPYFRYFVMALKTLHEYRANWFLSFLKVPVVLTLYWYLWRALFNYQGGNIGTYKFPDMVTYFTAVQWIAFILPPGIGDQVASDIRLGKINMYLARPISYLPSRGAHYLAHMLFNSVVSAIPFLTVMLLFGSPSTTAIQYFQFALLTFGAFFVHMQLEFCIGGSAFWLQKIFGLQYLLLTIFGLIGGKILPIEFFPPWLHWLAFLSPLRAVYGGPIEILLGGSFIETASTQLAWIALLFVVTRLLWSKGRYIYEAAG